MKKIIIILSILGSLSLMAQAPVLTVSNNGPVAGDQHISYYADTTGITEGSSGASQTWNYAGLQIQSTHVDFNYVDPAGTPYGASFPTATVAYSNGSTYSYQNANSADLSIVGLSSTTYTMVFSDPEKLFTYPFSYGTTFTDALAGTYTVGSFTFTRTGTRKVTGDAWGNLILPSGTYNNMLRVKIEQDYKDSSSASVTEVHNVGYMWFDGVHKFPVFQIYYITNISGGNPVYGKYVSISSIVSKVNEGYDNSHFMKLWPSPANDQIRFALPNQYGENPEGKCCIYNQSGQQVMEVQLSSRTSNIDISTLPSGSYWLIVQIGNQWYQSQFIRQ